MRIRIILTACLLIMLAVAVNAQDENRLDLNGGGSVQIVQDIDEHATSVKVRREKINLYFDSVGKTHPVPGFVLGTIRKTDPALFRQLRSLKTSYLLRQQDRKLYIRGLNTIDFRKLTKASYLECDIFLLEIRTPSGKSFIPIIRTMKRVHEPTP